MILNAGWDGSGNEGVVGGISGIGIEVVASCMKGSGSGMDIPGGGIGRGSSAECDVGVLSPASSITSSIVGSSVMGGMFSIPRDDDGLGAQRERIVLGGTDDAATGLRDTLTSVADVSDP